MYAEITPTCQDPAWSSWLPKISSKLVAYMYERQSKTGNISTPSVLPINITSVAPFFSRVGGTDPQTALVPCPSGYRVLHSDKERSALYINKVDIIARPTFSVQLSGGDSLYRYSTSHILCRRFASSPAIALRSSILPWVIRVLKYSMTCSIAARSFMLSINAVRFSCNFSVISSRIKNVLLSRMRYVSC